MKVLYATGNSGKFDAAAAFFALYAPNVELIQVADLDDCELQTLDQSRIATDKARACFQRYGQPSLADDAGVYFAAYNSFPGFMTKFVFKCIGLAGIMRLIAHDPRAEMRVYLAYVDATTTKVFTGVVVGNLIEPTEAIPAEATLTYSYLFVPNGEARRVTDIPKSELSEKNYARYSALGQCVRWLQSQVSA